MRCSASKSLASDAAQCRSSAARISWSLISPSLAPSTDDPPRSLTQSFLADLQSRKRAHAMEVTPSMGDLVGQWAQTDPPQSDILRRISGRTEIPAATGEDRRN